MGRSAILVRRGVSSISGFHTRSSQSEVSITLKKLVVFGSTTRHTTVGECHSRAVHLPTLTQPGRQVPDLLLSRRRSQFLCSGIPPRY